MPAASAWPIATHDPSSVGQWLTAVALVAGALALVAVPLAVVVAYVAGRRDRLPLAAGAALAVSIAVAAGWGAWAEASEEGHPDLGTEHSPARVTMTDLIEDAEAYEGMAVSVMGEVTAEVPPDALVLDQWIVVVPASGDLPVAERGDRVRVTGTVRPFDAVADRIGGGIEEGGHAGRFDGSHALVATDVDVVP